MSELNNQYIVRYYQTWVEVETDPAKLQDFPSDDSYEEDQEAEEEQMRAESDSYHSEEAKS